MCTTPSNIQVSNIGAGTATVTWDAVLDVLGYNIRFRYVDGSPVWVNLIAGVSPVWNFISLQPCRRVEFQVRSVCGSGNSAWSSSFFFTSNQSLTAAGSLRTYFGSLPVGKRIGVYRGDELTPYFVTTTPTTGNPLADAAFFEVDYNASQGAPIPTVAAGVSGNEVTIFYRRGATGSCTEYCDTSIDCACDSDLARYHKRFTFTFNDSIVAGEYVRAGYVVGCACIIDTGFADIPLSPGTASDAAIELAAALSLLPETVSAVPSGPGVEWVVDSELLPVNNEACFDTWLVGVRTNKIDGTQKAALSCYECSEKITLRTGGYEIANPFFVADDPQPVGGFLYLGDGTGAGYVECCGRDCEDGETVQQVELQSTGAGRDVAILDCAADLSVYNNNIIGPPYNAGNNPPSLGVELQGIPFYDALVISNAVGDTTAKDGVITFNDYAACEGCFRLYEVFEDSPGVFVLDIGAPQAEYLYPAAIPCCGEPAPPEPEPLPSCVSGYSRLIFTITAAPAGSQVNFAINVPPGFVCDTLPIEDRFLVAATWTDDADCAEVLAAELRIRYTDAVVTVQDNRIIFDYPITDMPCGAFAACHAPTPDAGVLGMVITEPTSTPTCCSTVPAEPCPDGWGVLEITFTDGLVTGESFWWDLGSGYVNIFTAALNYNAQQTAVLVAAAIQGIGYAAVSVGTLVVVTLPPVAIACGEVANINTGVSEGDWSGKVTNTAPEVICCGDYPPDPEPCPDGYSYFELTFVSAIETGEALYLSLDGCGSFESVGVNFPDGATPEQAAQFVADNFGLPGAVFTVTGATVLIAFPPEGAPFTCPGEACFQTGVIDPESSAPASLTDRISPAPQLVLCCGEEPPRPVTGTYPPLCLPECCELVCQIPACAGGWSFAVPGVKPAGFELRLRIWKFIKGSPVYVEVEGVYADEVAVFDLSDLVNSGWLTRYGGSYTVQLAGNNAEVWPFTTLVVGDSQVFENNNVNCVIISW